MGPNAWGGVSRSNGYAAGGPDPRRSGRENECGGYTRRLQEADAGGGCRRRRRKERRHDKETEPSHGVRDKKNKMFLKILGV